MEIRVKLKNGLENMSKSLPFDFDLCFGASEVSVTDGEGNTEVFQSPGIYAFNYPSVPREGKKYFEVVVGKQQDSGEWREVRIKDDGTMQVMNFDTCPWAPAVILNTTIKGQV